MNPGGFFYGLFIAKPINMEDHRRWKMKSFRSIMALLGKMGQANVKPIPDKTGLASGACPAWADGAKRIQMVMSLSMNFETKILK